MRCHNAFSQPVVTANQLMKRLTGTKVRVLDVSAGFSGVWSTLVCRVISQFDNLPDKHVLLIRVTRHGILHSIIDHIKTNCFFTM